MYQPPVNFFLSSLFRIRMVYDQPIFIAGGNLSGVLILEWNAERTHERMASIDAVMVNTFESRVLTGKLEIVTSSDYRQISYENLSQAHNDTEIVQRFSIPIQDDGSPRLLVPFCVPLPVTMPGTSMGATGKVSMISLSSRNKLSLSFLTNLRNCKAEEFEFLVGEPGVTKPVLGPVLNTPMSCCRPSEIGEVSLRSDRSWYLPGTCITVFVNMKAAHHLSSLLLTFRSNYKLEQHSMTNQTDIPWSMHVESKRISEENYDGVAAYEFVIPNDAPPSCTRKFGTDAVARYDIVLHHSKGGCSSHATDEMVTLPIVIRPFSVQPVDWAQKTQEVLAPGSNVTHYDPAILESTHQRKMQNL